MLSNMVKSLKRKMQEQKSIHTAFSLKKVIMAIAIYSILNFY